MTFAKRPDNDLERPYRSNLVDLTVLTDEQLKRRRTFSIVALPGFAAMFVAGCIGLALNPRSIGQLTLVAGAATLGIIMTVMLTGGLIRIRSALEERRWARALDEKDRADDAHRPWAE